MPLEISIEGTQKIEAAGEAFARARARIREMVAKSLQEFGNETVGTIKKEYLTGPRPQRLEVKSNRLRSSIRYRINDTGGETITVSFGSDVKYARIHELGGTIKHPGGTAFIFNSKRGAGAIWISNKAAGAGWPDVLRTKPHNITIPDRPFLRPGVEDNLPGLKRDLASILERVAQEAGNGQ